MATKTITVLLKAVSGAYRAELTKASAATAALGNATTRLGKAQQALVGALGPTGFAAAKVAAGFAGVGGLAFALKASTQAAIEWEHNFTRVRKTVDGSEQQLAKIADEFRGLARSMPATHEELTAVGEAAGQLGIQTNQVTKFTENMVKMGVTTNLSADEAATGFARLANIMQTPQEEFDKLTASAVHLGNTFPTTEEEILSMSLRLAGVANVAGLTEGEVMGLSAAMTAVGVKAERGGSAFGRVIITMQEAVESGGGALENFAEVSGITAEQFARTWAEDPSEAIAIFFDGLSEAKNRGDNLYATLEELGLQEIRVRDTTLALAGAQGLVAETMRAGNESYAEGTALVDEYGKFAETTSSKLGVLRNSVKDLGITFGEDTANGVGVAAEALTSFINHLNAVFEEAESENQNFGDLITRPLRDIPPRLASVTRAFGEFLDDTVDTDRQLEEIAAAFGVIGDAVGELQRDLDEEGLFHVLTEPLRDLPSSAQRVVESFLDLVGTSQNVVSSQTTLDERFNTTADSLSRYGGEVASANSLSVALQENQARGVAQQEHAAAVAERYADRTAKVAEMVQAAGNAQKEAGEVAQVAAEQMQGLTEEQLDLLDSITDYPDAVGDMMDSTRSWMDTMTNYQAMLEARNEAEREAAEATEEARDKEGDSWEDYFTEVEASFSVYMASLEEQRQAQIQWHENIQTIREKAGDRYANLLMAQGPEFASLHAEIAAQSQAEIRAARNIEFEIREKAAREQLKLLEDTGALRLEEHIAQGTAINQTTGELTEEMVSILSEELGVSRDVVRTILQDDDRILREQLSVMIGNTDRLSGDLVAQMAEQLGVSKKRVRDIFEDNKDILTTALSRMEGIATDGGGNIVDGMGRKLAGGAQVIARVVSEYGRLLAEGLNPVILSVGGKSIAFRSVSAARTAGRVAQYERLGRAEGGIDHPRPGAHITNQMSILYGEPETGGEAFIPLSPAKRPRSRMIAQETVARLGGDVMWFQEGGFTSTADVPKVPRNRTPSGAFGDTADDAMAHTREAAVKWMEENLFPDLGGMAAPGRYRAMFAAVKKAFPWITLISGFRPGAITATGNPSYHGMGRAIDINPSMEVFRWIAKHYGRKTKELIFSPAGNNQIHNGSPHFYSGITRAMHWDHIHWAMRRGGIIGRQLAHALGVRKYKGADQDLLLGNEMAEGGIMSPGELQELFAQHGVPPEFGTRETASQRFARLIRQMAGGRTRLSIERSLERLAEKLARGWFNQGQITMDDWRDLRDKYGWRGAGMDFAERIYRPFLLSKIQRGVIPHGTISDEEWEGLKRLGWRGNAVRDQMVFGRHREALYPPSHWKIAGLGEGGEDAALSTKRIRALFHRYGVPLGFGTTESADERISRIQAEMRAGRTETDLRKSLRRLSQLSGWTSALTETIRAVRSDVQFFEDFSFRGMSDNARRHNDAIADRFYSDHPGADFPEVGEELILRALRRYHRQAKQYDSGGILPPGVTMSVNNTGGPEVVAAEGMIAGEVYRGLTRRAGDVRMSSAGMELLNHILGGGTFFEDASYRGMSQAFAENNDDLSKAIWRNMPPGFNFGEPGTREVFVRALERVLRNWTPQPGAAGIITEVPPGISSPLIGRLPPRQRTRVSSKRMRPQVYERAVAQNNFLFEQGLLSIEDHLSNLGRRLLRYVPYSDEWMAIFRERQQTVQTLLDQATQRLESALQAQAAAYDNLNSLLDERDRLLEAMTEAEQQYNERVLEATERRNEALLEAEEEFDRRRDEIIRQRAESLFNAFDPMQRAERVWANTIGAVTRNVRSQVEDFTRWAEGLDLLRSMGLSEDAIQLLGLGDFTAESLATVQMWSNATQDEIDALNAAIIDRQEVANDQAAIEAQELLGTVGRELIALTEETNERIAQINEEYQESVEQFADELSDTMAELREDLQAIGQDQGRSYAEALAEGLRSGIPGIVAAARELQTAINDTRSAEAALSDARRTAANEPAAGTQPNRAPLGRLYDTKNLGWMLRLSDATWWQVERTALPYAKKIWGPGLKHPNIDPARNEGKVIADLFGPGVLQRLTPNPQPRYFAQGGFIERPMIVGDAGMERVRIDPLTRDRMTPHERRVERVLNRIAEAAERNDQTINIDGREVAQVVSGYMRQDARREMVAQGRGTWRS